jgi:uncharacterized protein
MSTALITGASSGIGMELAKKFAMHQHDLVLVARSEDKLRELAADLQLKYSIHVKVIVKDLGDMKETEDVYQFCKQSGITIDYLINNAGFGDFALFMEADWEKIEQMIELNVKSLTRMCRLFVPDMVQRGNGRIMNVASTASFQPGPYMAVYYGTKAFVLHLSEAMAEELKDSGVKVTALCPGPTESGFQQVAAWENSRMIKGKKLPSSAEVAGFGYKMMMKGRRVAIHGFMNKFMALGYRFLPRKWVVKMVKWVQKEK